MLKKVNINVYLSFCNYSITTGENTPQKKPNVKSPEQKTHLKVDLAGMKPVIKINCIVVKAELHAVIDLYALSKNVRGVDYEPEQFPGAIYKVNTPSATIILFKNGKMICTGTNTIANVKKVLEIVANVVSKYVLEETPKSKEIPKSK